MIAGTRAPGRRGTRLLLEHCGAFAVPDLPRRSAVDRLGDLLGDELARRLVRALSRGRRDPDFPAAA